MATARARHMTNNFTSPSNLTEDMNAEELKQYFVRLENNLEDIGVLVLKWKEEMDTVLGAMDEFQVKIIIVLYSCSNCSSFRVMF